MNKTTVTISSLDLREAKTFNQDVIGSKSLQHRARQLINLNNCEHHSCIGLPWTSIRTFRALIEAKHAQNWKKYLPMLFCSYGLLNAEKRRSTKLNCNDRKYRKNPWSEKEIPIHLEWYRHPFTGKIQLQTTSSMHWHQTDSVPSPHSTTNHPDLH